MPVAAAVVGTAYSIYSGQEKEQQEKAARDAAQSGMDAQNGMAAQDKEWYDSNVRPFLSKLTNEATAPGLSSSGKLEQDAYLHQMGTVGQRMAAQATARGADSNLNAAENAGMQMEQARGLSNISLKDAMNKKQAGIMGAQLAGFGSMADRQAIASRQTSAQFDEGNANRLGQEADQSWSGLASGMQAIARSYSDYKNPGTPGAGNGGSPTAQIEPGATDAPAGMTKQAGGGYTGNLAGGLNLGQYNFDNMSFAGS